MSIRLMTQVWELDLPRNEKLVLLALADHANDDGYCYPSVRRIAWKSGYDRRSIQRILRRLEDAEVLESAVEGGGRANPTTYRVVPEKGVKLPPFIPLALAERASNEPQKGDILNTKGDIFDGKGDTHAARTVIEPSFESSKKPPARSLSKNAKPNPKCKPCDKELNPAKDGWECPECWTFYRAEAS